MEENKLKKVLFIYCLEDVFDESFLDELKKSFKVHSIVCLIADNKLEHTQYPYFTIEEFEI